MPDPDTDTEPERRTDPRFDDWPVERNDAFADVPVERATPREDDADDTEALEWIGFAGLGGTAPGPYVYDAEESAIYEGEHDDDRLVLREDSRRDVEDEQSLGEHIEEIGADHGWTWLSSFAREYLEDDEERDGPGTAPGLELRDSEFGRRNLPDSSSIDLGLFGSHTLADESGQVRVVDRYFAVDDVERDPVAVDVEEEFLAAEAPAEDRREGDAELVEERQYGFELGVSEGAANREARVESALRTWHAAHVGWPAAE